MRLIVGIDPGVTTGVAVTDLRTDYYETFSARHMSPGDVCHALSQKGEPILIATDVQRVPRGVRKIAAAFNARLVHPAYDLTSAEKHKLVSGRSYGNTHERDALSAALFAGKKCAPVCRKVDFSLKQRGMLERAEDVKELLIQGNAGNIEQAVALLTAGGKEVPVQKAPRQRTQRMPSADDVRVKRLARRLRELEEENRGLRHELYAAKHRPESAAVQNLRRSIAALVRDRKRLADEYELYRNLSQRYEIIVPADAEDITDKVVLLPKGVNPGVVEARNPKALIAGTYVDTDIPVIPADRIRIEKIGDFLVADKKDVESLLASSFIDWLKKYKEARRNI
ncbi:MAG: DUF460 domain-containing protein [Candidatus Aenigmarchaeota archaeon]|nr:DUF460 domain-containing protein [Candidatus Aenigmarchaeota archaeon]